MYKNKKGYNFPANVAVALLKSSAISILEVAMRQFEF